MPSLHVRHDLTSVVAREAMLLLLQASAGSAGELRQRAQERGLELGERRSPEKALASLRDLGLVGRASGRGIGLTPLGRRLAEVACRDPLLFGELVHLRYWWLWATRNPEVAFSWAYRLVADLLWEEAPTMVDSDRLVATVLAAAEREFNVAGASFSPSSVLGVLHWLRALSPPCLDGSNFRRRQTCPPESVVVCVEGIQAEQGRRALGAPVRLDAPVRERICRATLLDDAALDDVLIQANETLGLVRRSGDGGDLVMLREPLVPELVPRCTEQ
jgi:hypothetical protein